MRTWVQITSAHVKSWVWQHAFVNWALEGSDRDRKISGACWSAYYTHILHTTQLCTHTDINKVWKKNKILGWWNGLKGRGICQQGWWFEFYASNPHRRRRELTPPSCSLTSTGMSWHSHSHLYTKNKYMTKCKFLFFDRVSLVQTLLEVIL